jgi:hypothetical protein
MTGHATSRYQCLNSSEVGAKIENLGTWLMKTGTYACILRVHSQWRFNLSLPWVSVLFLNSWRVSLVPHYVTTHPPAIQKQHWYSRQRQIEPPLFECEYEWAFRIQALGYVKVSFRMRLQMIAQNWPNMRKQPRKDPRSLSRDQFYGLRPTFLGLHHYHEISSYNDRYRRRECYRIRHNCSYGFK